MPPAPVGATVARRRPPDGPADQGGVDVPPLILAGPCRELYPDADDDAAVWCRARDARRRWLAERDLAGDDPRLPDAIRRSERPPWSWSVWRVKGWLDRELHRRGLPADWTPNRGE